MIITTQAHAVLERARRRGLTRRRIVALLEAADRRSFYSLCTALADDDLAYVIDQAELDVSRSPERWQLVRLRTALSEQTRCRQRMTWLARSDRLDISSHPQQAHHRYGKTHEREPA